MTICSIVDGAELSCYIRFSIYFGGKKRFSLHIIPSDLDILFDIFCTCPFHVKCWSIVNPKKLKSVTRSIICSFKFSCGIRFSMFRCLWWKIINFVFLTLTHLDLTLFCRSPPGPIREIEGFATHICVTREMRAVFHDAYMRHQAKMS